MVCVGPGVFSVLQPRLSPGPLYDMTPHQWSTVSTNLLVICASVWLFSMAWKNFRK
jgi:hypothetical protein